MVLVLQWFGQLIPAPNPSEMQCTSSNALVSCGASPFLRANPWRWFGSRGTFASVSRGSPMRGSTRPIRSLAYVGMTPNWSQGIWWIAMTSPLDPS